MRIRDLAWTHRKVEGENAYWYEADRFDYSIEPMDGRLMLWIDGEQAESFDSLEEGQAFAQKDFEKRVRKCLIL